MIHSNNLDTSTPRYRKITPHAFFKHKAVKIFLNFLKRYLGCMRLVCILGVLRPASGDPAAYRAYSHIAKPNPFYSAIKDKESYSIYKDTI
jgi:hypothetical protein